jgi:transcriptional regulator with XRE-family HTH domain
MKQKLLIEIQILPGKVSLKDIQADKIIAKMKRRGITERELVQQTGLSKQTVWRIINNKIEYTISSNGGRNVVSLKIESILIVTRVLGLELQFKFIE